MTDSWLCPPSCSGAHPGTCWQWVNKDLMWPEDVLQGPWACAEKLLTASSALMGDQSWVIPTPPYIGPSFSCALKIRMRTQHTSSPLTRGSSQKPDGMEIWGPGKSVSSACRLGLPVELGGSSCPAGTVPYRSVGRGRNSGNLGQPGCDSPPYPEESWKNRFYVFACGKIYTT